MEQVVIEVLSSILKDWLKDNSGKTIDLMTEDMKMTKHIFCTCLDEQEIQYQMIEDRLIIGNKKIYFYDMVRSCH